MNETIETAPAPAPALVNGAALVAAQPVNPLAMPVSPRFVVERYKAIQEIIREVFVDGEHFGEIPGTAKDKNGKAKKVLLKGGFDALCNAFQFAPDFTKQSESIESDKFINLVYKCVLTSASGRVIATGIGSCNSKEEKYRWKPNVKRACPACGNTASLLKSKDRPEWFCWAKKDGCGAKFPLDDDRITSQKVEREENDNPWNHHNTLTKMAQKRAGMAAIITACGISGDFTQDMEDFDPALDKAKRGEPGIDVQANNQPPAWQARAEADDRTYTEDTPHGHGQDGTDWREGLEGAAARAEDAEFKPAGFAKPAPEIDPETNAAYPPGIQAARNYIRHELGKCAALKDIDALSNLMQKTAGAYSSPKVIGLVTEARAKFQADRKVA